MKSGRLGLYFLVRGCRIFIHWDSPNTFFLCDLPQKECRFL